MDSIYRMDASARTVSGRRVKGMRTLYGMLAGVLWVFLMATATAKYGAKIPDNIQWLTTAIVVAGAMAGGD